uniref:protein-serine/threonine phosphatase n=1 Tax=Leptobrachium leishanense TaxID=445787 RepID=A0A8C5Q265_9ANUR
MHCNDSTCCWVAFIMQCPSTLINIGLKSEEVQSLRSPGGRGRADRKSTMALVTLQLSPLDGTVSATPAENDEKSRRKRMQRRQSFVMVKGAALLLQEEGEQEQVTEPPPTSGPSEQQLHLQAMLTLLREEDTLRLAVRLEPVRSCVTRYLLVVSFVGTSSDGETILLGVDFPHDGSQDCTIGMVLPVLAKTQVFLDGDGGFSVTSGTDVRAFKPISVQTMWSLLQMLHKTCEGALTNFTPGSNLHSGVNYYMEIRGSPQGCVNAWATSPDISSTIRDPSTPEREEIESIIRKNLRDILRESDLENITSKEVRSALEKHTLSNLQDYTEFIDNEMIIILAQMDRPSEIFSYLYLGSEWNASNLDDLQKNKVSHILNVTREIDNFFPETFTYLNIRVLDEENTNLLQYWKETHRFISSARQQHSCVLVHCKMGISRSASTVIAYAMKQYEWTMEEALKYVKERRNVVQPNAGFMRQLHIYQGILGASKQRHNVLWDPKSTPLTHELSNPLKSLPGKRSLNPSSRPKKISLRTLMRSISEMEGIEPLQQEKSSNQGDMEEKSSSDRDQCVKDQTDGLANIEELVTGKDDSNMEEVCGNPMKQDDLFEDQNESKSGEENENVCTPMPGNSFTEEIIPSIEKDENTSVDEISRQVFGSTSHKPQSPRAASSSARRRSRRKKKLLWFSYFCTL